MLENENINRLAYLNTLEKKPFDLLLELIEIEAFDYDFNEKKSISSSGINLSDILKRKYNISISDFFLDKWIPSNFDLVNSKLVLKNSAEDISCKVHDIKSKENEFLEKMNSIKNDFISFAKNEFNKKVDRELARKIFDSYIYSAANTSVFNKVEGVGKDYYFIFQEFLKSLLKNDIDKLSIIENFGIANQIQDLILIDKENDEKFLDGCNIFLDTPIMMKRLGYDGKELYDSYEKVIDFLKKAGAKTFIFEHTFDEIWGILFNFKRSVALNILNAKGVSTFLKARQEFSESGLEADSILTLDKDSVRKNIKDLGIEFFDSNKDEFIDSDYNSWDFDEQKYLEILKNESASDYKTWIERDSASVSAIHRLRSKSGIQKINNYKDGKYYLLISNYILISALKKYYETEDFCPQKNELLLENTLLFQLWQQLGENGNLIRSLFRSKCFAMNVIDDNFRDRLYKNARRIEAYNSYLDIKDSIIDNPAIENELYAGAIKDNKKFDDAYISSTLENRITIEKEAFKKELNRKNETIEQERTTKLEMSREIRKLNQMVEEQNRELEISRNEAIKQTKVEEQNAAVDRLAKKLQQKISFMEKIKILINRFFNKTFNEERYFYEKAKVLLEETE